MIVYVKICDDGMRSPTQDRQSECECIYDAMGDEFFVFAIYRVIYLILGTGGDEAGLFAGEMFRMYERYSNVRNWKFESLNISGDILGVIKVGVIGRKKIRIDLIAYSSNF